MHIGMIHSIICLTVPSRVTNVSVTMSLEDGNLNLTVSWTTPQSELPITEYEVEYEDVSEVMNITLSGSPPANATILSELDAGVEYIVIKVRALSEIGAGAWSEEQMVTPADSECIGVSAVKRALSTLHVIVKELSHPVHINLLCYSCSLLFAKHCMTNC